MKYFFDIKEIDKTLAINFIQERHYSKVLPRLTKHWLGCFYNGELVGVLTLGWGTQPLQTIKKLFIISQNTCNSLVWIINCMIIF